MLPSVYLFALATLALRNPKRFSFSDYLSLSHILPRYVSTSILRSGLILALRYAYRISISIRFNRLHNQCTMLSLFGTLRSTSCVYPRVFISHRSDISFYYFSMFKICSSRHSFFILYTLFPSIVTHLFSNYTVRPRSKLLFHPCPFFSFFQACSDSSPSHLPTVIPSNRPLSTHFPPSYDRPLAAPRFLNLYLSDFYLDP